jgi:hypothetical protein
MVVFVRGGVSGPSEGVSMARKICAVAVLALGLLAYSAGPGFADDDKAPDPLKVLRKAAKNLVDEAKKSGYQAGCEVAGGLSKTGDHKLHMTTVQESYTGEILGDIMRVPAMNVYRTTSKGALFNGEQWYQLQALPEGKKLDRLFAFPLRLMTTALTKPERIEWLPSTETPEVVEEEVEAGRTTVEKQLTQEQLYHRMRVQVPDEEALQYFTEVQNSGCLSGG